MPATIGIISGALGAVGGIAKVIGAGNDYDKAKAEQDALKRPFYDIQKEYFQNRNIAANEASVGLGSAAKDFATTQLEGGVGAGISAVQQAGGDPNIIAQILAGYNSGVNELASMDSTARLQNIKNFMEYNKDLAGQKNIQKQINEFNPYYDKMAFTSQQMGIAKANKTQGWNDFLGGLSAAATSMSNADLQKAQIGAYNRMGNNGFGVDDIAKVAGVGMRTAVPQKNNLAVAQTESAFPNDGRTYGYLSNTQGYQNNLGSLIYADN